MTSVDGLAGITGNRLMWVSGGWEVAAKCSRCRAILSTSTLIATISYVSFITRLYPLWERIAMNLDTFVSFSVIWRCSG